MADLYFRTENIRPEELPNLIVISQLEKDIIESLKSNSNLILEGSRGTGKSFLMKFAAYELETNFQEEKILPVYITFMASTLIHSSDPFQFRNWMIARSLRELMKSCLKKGLLFSKYASTLLNVDGNVQDSTSKLDEIIRAYEASYKNPGSIINSSSLPELNDIIDALNELCEKNQLKGIYFYFDEAAHIFRPEQQRQFFTFFRDLRSPYVSSKAAVYPGVTHFGETFESVHDATFKKIDRNIQDLGYLGFMNSMVQKQVDPTQLNSINQHKDVYNALVFCANGNPRILLKTTERLPKIGPSEIETLIRTFFRNEIWIEHTLLGDKFKGHKLLVDWGRKFVEDTVIPNLVKKNLEENGSVKPETSLFFWVHKDSPIQVREALRLLTYTGIIRKVDDGVKGSRSLIGTRYEVNYGVFLSQVTNPVKNSRDIISRLQLNNFSEYGHNHSAYNELSNESIVIENEASLVESINSILQQSPDVLDLTNWQKNKLIKEAGISTIKEVIDISEEELMNKLYQVGTVRSRQMKNAAYAEVLEFISG
ncbi:hypothetical protein [Chitinophaga sp. Cy-1792]|uniref:hypothetical protein n=1 Tax=Chitinophaga sp. Cy-1792 TaxID=2608339 RepID=UPI00142072C1|nr:hypothetical protein [Chitinophaga sp. Cy-1792]NIG56962.1 hypothetical protein [Chitinophaga sp. Cy-1792]